MRAILCRLLGHDWDARHRFIGYVDPDRAMYCREARCRCCGLADNSVYYRASSLPAAR